MKYTIEIPNVPKGWKPVAYRRPKKGEWILSNDTSGGVHQVSYDFNFINHLIVEKESNDDVSPRVE